MSNEVKETEPQLGIIRYSEYRPQTLTADITIEIPPIIHHVTEEDLTPLNFHFWVEFTSLTKKKAQILAKKIDQMIKVALNTGRKSYRKFPPVPASYELHIHFLSWFEDLNVQEDQFSLSHDNLIRITGRTLYREIEKVIHEKYSHQSSSWDPSRWSLRDGLEFLQNKVPEVNKKFLSGENIHILLFSGWNTEKSVDSTVNKYPSLHKNLELNRGHLISLVPKTTTLKMLEEILGLNSVNLSDINEKLWKQSLLNLIEPILDCRIKFTPDQTWGQNFSFASNLSLFEQVTREDRGVILRNIRSVRYPVRFNLVFQLPSESLQSMDSFTSLLWEKITISLIGRKKTIKQTMETSSAYTLPLANPEYQAERELNERIRLADSLRQKIDSLLKKVENQSEKLTQWIKQPQSIESSDIIGFIGTNLNDLDLSFQILDYLAEEELLLAETRPVVKTFQPNI
ncbi:MAG: hypothetical protein ACXAC7_12365 [Candidatus Hodarchaeales archaeon]|jgi:hypothetical protein